MPDGVNAPDRHDAYLLADGEEKLTYGADEKIPHAGTFVLNKEGHTAGDLVRTQLLRNDAVKYCGYALPHPLDHRVILKALRGGV
mmetsp:Transcript_21361/g.63899  ORF Transcript_21361/g.63899 Transcript_21361/m.63899 type:complete len:85 (-) Transcript_21361:106-360(-)